MRATLAIGVVAAAALAAGCRSGAWELVDDPVAEALRPELPSWPGHRAIENVHLEVYGREFDFVGYRAAQPVEVNVHEFREDIAVRASLQLDAGVSVLDVAVRGYAPNGVAERRISGSVFEAIPHFAEVAMDDLRRIWGPESVFAVAGDDFNRRQVRLLLGFGGNTWRAVPRGRGWTAWTRMHRAYLSGYAADALMVVHLDQDLMPQALTVYSDFDDDGIPHEIEFNDFRQKHTLRIEVQEVHLVDDAVPASTFETPAPAR